MSEMIERVSAAMKARRRELIGQPLDRVWPELTRAAIESMREPTEEMESAFKDDLQAWLDEVITDENHLWKVQIDTALGKAKEE